VFVYLMMLQGFLDLSHLVYDFTISVQIFDLSNALFVVLHGSGRCADYELHIK
jgi:hypothetical protein